MAVPDSRSERIVFFVGLGAILALAVALVPALRHYQHRPHAEAFSPIASAGASNEPTAYRPARRHTAPAARTSRASKPAAAATASPTQTPAQAQTVRLTLTARRGDCWAEIHRGSANGKLLYQGTLVKGKTYKVAVGTLWIRFGAPQNVEVAIDGKTATIPTGTQDVLVTRAGVRAAA